MMKAIDVYFELRDASQGYIPGVRKIDRGEVGESLYVGESAKRLASALEKYTIEGFEYPRTDSFNPVVAKELLVKTKKLTEGYVVADEFLAYHDSFEKILEGYARETDVQQHLDERDKIAEEAFGRKDR